MPNRRNFSSKQMRQFPCIYIYICINNIHFFSDLLETYDLMWCIVFPLVMPAENAETREARLATDFLADMTDGEGHGGDGVEVANARLAEKYTTTNQLERKQLIEVSVKSPSIKTKIIVKHTMVRLRACPISASQIPAETTSAFLKVTVNDPISAISSARLFALRELAHVQPPQMLRKYHMSVGTGGSPKNWSVWWCKCNKTPLFTVFSAHTQIAFMLMLREHMPCLFATRGRFFMTFWIHFHHNISKLHSLACLRDMLSIVHLWKMLDFTAPVSENDFPLLFTMNLGP